MLTAGEEGVREGRALSQSGGPRVTASHQQDGKRSLLSQKGRDKEISGSFKISCANERIPGAGGGSHSLQSENVKCSRRPLRWWTGGGWGRIRMMLDCKRQTSLEGKSRSFAGVVEMYCLRHRLGQPEALQLPDWAKTQISGASVLPSVKRDSHNSSLEEREY